MLGGGIMEKVVLSRFSIRILRRIQGIKEWFSSWRSSFWSTSSPAWMARSYPSDISVCILHAGKNHLHRVKSKNGRRPSNKKIGFHPFAICNLKFEMIPILMALLGMVTTWWSTGKRCGSQMGSRFKFEISSKMIIAVLMIMMEDLNLLSSSSICW